MRSRFLAVLAAVAFAAAPAAAQTSITSFKLLGGAWSPNQPTVAFGVGNYYSSPYLGSIDHGVSSFWVWCVDYNHSVNFGDEYSAELTPLSASLTNLDTYTRYHSAALNGYEWAAYFAGQMTSADPTRAVQLQLAMWDAVSRGGFATDFGTTSDLGLALVALGFGSNPTFYNNPAPLLDRANWALIDGTYLDGGLDNTVKQEFLVRIDGRGNPTDTVVPEPVTMSLLATGLAGMALAGRKRRRNTA